MNNYYKDNKDEFIEKTINCDMSFQYNFFQPGGEKKKPKPIHS